MIIDIRRACAMALAISFVFLTGCGSTPDHTDAVTDDSLEAWKTAEIFISYATSQKNQEGKNELLKQYILESTDGRIYCNAYSGETMGDDDLLLSAVQSGALSVVQMSTASQTPLLPELALLDTPYLFTSAEECNELLNGDLLEFFQPFYNREGLQLLAWKCFYFHQLTSSFLVESPSDLSRLNIRLLNNEYRALYWSALGAKTRVIPFSDLFYAVQQGVVNAYECPPNGAVIQKTAQFQPRLLLTEHAPFVSCVVMNKECYDSLSAQDQEMLVSAFRELYSNSGSVSEPETSEYFSSIDTPSPALEEALHQAAGTVREALREDLGVEVADAFYALAEVGNNAEENAERSTD